MRRPFEAWRRNPWLWGLPLGFCLLNLLILFFYRSFYAGDVERLEKDYLGAVQDLAALEQESAQIDAFLARAETQNESIHRLYQEHFQSEAERFTRAISEVKRLAREAGLDPTAFSYPERQLEQEGLIQRGINFTVQGTYRQLRTFINFLELSDQFLTLNDVTMSGGGSDPRDPQLSIRLTLSTVFAGASPRQTPEGPAT